jgi:galactoside O-acetyltransferase
MHCGREGCEAGYECAAAQPVPLNRHPTAPPPPVVPTMPRAGYMVPRTRYSKQYDGPPLAKRAEGSYVSAGAELRRPHLVSVGKHSNLDWGVYCTTALHLGDYVHLAAQCSIIGGANASLMMHHFSTLGVGSRVVCASDARGDGEGLVGPAIPWDEHARVDCRPVVFEPLAIGTTGIMVMPGVTLGIGCLIGAGALVLKSTDPWGIYVGVPARKVGERPRAKVLEAAKRLGYDFSIWAGEAHG